MEWERDLKEQVRDILEYLRQREAREPDFGVVESIGYFPRTRIFLHGRRGGPGSGDRRYGRPGPGPAHRSREGRVRQGRRHVGAAARMPAQPHWRVSGPGQRAGRGPRRAAWAGWTESDLGPSTVDLMASGGSNAPVRSPSWGFVVKRARGSRWPCSPAGIGMSQSSATAGWEPCCRFCSVRRRFPRGCGATMRGSWPRSRGIARTSGSCRATSCRSR